jgi:hypothetical protein
MNFRIISLGLVFYVSYCSASELMVYRWLDKNNVVHFSQHQPIDDEYTQFLISNQSKVISRADVMPLLPTNKSGLSKSDKDNIPSTINTSEKCMQAKENLAMLLAFKKLQYIDENGVKQILNEQEKNQQLAISNKPKAHRGLLCADKKRRVTSYF